MSEFDGFLDWVAATVLYFASHFTGAVFWVYVLLLSWKRARWMNIAHCSGLGGEPFFPL